VDSVVAGRPESERSQQGPASDVPSFSVIRVVSGVASGRPESERSQQGPVGAHRITEGCYLISNVLRSITVRIEIIELN
jgi:hypothetical protein